MNITSSFSLGALLVSIALCISPTIAFAYLEGHINMWSFDEGAGRTLIDRAGTANGTVLGENVEWVKGRSGTALHLSGQSDQGISIPRDFLKKGEGTTGLWLNMDKLTAGNIIFSAKQVGSDNVYMLLSVDELGRVVITERSGTSNAEQIFRTTGRLEAGKWQMVIFTVLNGNYTVYIGGVAQTWEGVGLAKGEWFSDAVSGSIEYMIGASRIPGHLGVFSGIIDDLCFFDHGFPKEEAELLVTLNAQYNDQVANEIVVTMNPDDDHVPYGGTTTLRWNSTGATSCVASGSWEGVRELSGSMVLENLTETGTYFLLCSKAPSLVSGVQGTITVDPQPWSNTPPPDKRSAMQPAPISSHTQHEPTLPAGCTEYLHSYLRRGAANNKSEVIKLQQFLNEVMNAKLPVTGYFGPLTHSWVKRFQVRYHDTIIKPWTDVGYDTSGMAGGTGYVYKTTKYHINFMKCASLNAPKPDLLPDIVR